MNLRLSKQRSSQSRKKRPLSSKMMTSRWLPKLWKKMAKMPYRRSLKRIWSIRKETRTKRKRWELRKLKKRMSMKRTVPVVRMMLRWIKREKKSSLLRMGTLNKRLLLVMMVARRNLPSQPMEPGPPE